ncbi:N,N-dimethylformamidase beta subunit family domain-containing protein [Rufibacter tibetensis]|uniref:N,N-dimethylformamidase beta subunit-like C-terminal domain-containing protein n=1 Tax=Rufibacter tibetensis TaxID=512763 RepID=A0A0P0CUZ3_9BACT|nr:N,N-dimethylformamidase beta subunit family domain-containing protein [Rufibacter tibetensis]ALI98171.1 hypothetical protein DC20_03235 [Rufibacter tibetensis]
MELLKKVIRTFPFLRAVFLKTAGPLRHFAWRLKPTPRLTIDAVTPDMVPQPLEGYTDKPFYLPGETIGFHLKAELPQNQLQLQRNVGDQQWEEVAVHAFDTFPQPDVVEEAQNGCGWRVGWQFQLPPTANAGYYCALLTNPALEKPAEIHFLVGTASPISTVAVLAPVTTWLAYNAYGGQSLYRNAINEGLAPFVSGLRPNSALTYEANHPLQHNLRIEANIFHWFYQLYEADLYPDYYLEVHPNLFEKHQVLVLAYHAEYFSQKMYASLRNLIFQQRKSLLALGGNQVYWQVRWHQNFTKLECRKNGEFFQNETQRGCLWRHTPYPEAQLLGAQFSEPGMGTFAPYQVLEPDHWLFAGSGVKENETFGERGLDQLPICGDETDKTSWSTPVNTVILGKGLNKEDGKGTNVYSRTDTDWNGIGGGEITFTELSPSHAVLNTGSIQSGSGLGTDTVFTSLIQNFMRRYVRTATCGTTAEETAKAPSAL